MNATVQLINRYMDQCPLIAILRGITSDQVLDYGIEIEKAGWRCIEVPLNSPDPLSSIKRLSVHFGERVLIGAGTVTTVQEVADVVEAGGKLIFSPNTNVDVIEAAQKHGLAVIPGVMTPTEAFAAYQAGAHFLKLFPADLVGAAYVKALKSVLPSAAKIVPVGGITLENMKEFLDAGAAVFGIGSQLYKSGNSLAATSEAAQQFVAKVKSYRVD